MSLETWLSIAGPVLAAGVAWWCKTIWAEAKAAGVAAHRNKELAATAIASVQTELHQYQRHVAETYTSKEDMRALDARIMERFDKLDDKLDRKADR